jgi:uncharacterized cupredoxin-like copper-binding protein
MMPRPDLRLIAATALLLAIFATVLVTWRPIKPGPTPNPPVAVTLQEMAFVPGRILARQGLISLRLTNAGSLEHDFSSDDHRISPNVRPGETVEFTFEAGPGEYPVYCSLPGHREAGMAASLTVEP